MHYEELLSKTAKFRGRPFHDLKGYTGPWIENHFIGTRTFDLLLVISV